MQIPWLKVIAVVSLMETAAAGAIPDRKRELFDGVRPLSQTVVLTCYSKASSINVTGILDVCSKRCEPGARPLPVLSGRRSRFITAV
jgi:hypothetical protein